MRAGPLAVILPLVGSGLAEYRCAAPKTEIRIRLRMEENGHSLGCSCRQLLLQLSRQEIRD